MKKIIIILFVLMGFLSEAQILQPVPATGFRWNRGQFDVFLNLPNKCDTNFTTNDRTLLRDGSFFFNHCDSSFYYFYNNKWRVQTGKAIQLTDSSFTIGGDTITIRGTGGSSATFEQAIDNGNVFSKDNSIDFAGNDFILAGGGFDLRDVTAFYMPWANFDPGSIEGTMYYKNSGERFRGYVFGGWDNFVMDRQLRDSIAALRASTDTSYQGLLGTGVDAFRISGDTTKWRRLGDYLSMVWDTTAQGAARVALVNDAATPGNNKLYGTNGSGIKGWYSQPAPGADSSIVKQGSIDVTPSGTDRIIKFVNDQTSPGNNKVYGTDGSGVKGWKADPAGGGSPGGSDQDIQYNSSSAFAGSSGRFVWNNTAKRQSIFSTSTADLTWLNDHALKIIGTRIYLGDTTLDEPHIVELGNPYGLSTGSSVRMTWGWMGTEEMNFGINFHYRGGTHYKYDYSRFATWIAYNTDYFLMQAQGIGYAWNDNGGSKVTWSIYNTKVGNRFTGSIANFNGLNIVDEATSSYQNNDGRVATFRHTGGSLNIAGMQRLAIPDSTYFDLGYTSDGTYKLNINAGYFGGRGLRIFSNENNANGTETFFDRLKGASRTLTTGTVMGGINANSVGTARFVASSANNGGSFTIPDYHIEIQNTVGADVKRFSVMHDGLVGISNATPTAWLHLPASTTAAASLRIPSGTAPTSPNSGDMWYDGTHLYFRNSSTNVDLFSTGGGGGGSTPNWEDVLTQGGNLSADKNYRLNTKKVTFNVTSSAGGLELSGITPTFNFIDTVNSNTGYVKNDGAGSIAIGGTSGMAIKLNNYVVTSDASSPDPLFGFNAGSIRSITTNPNSLAEPNLIWVNNGTGNQLTIYKNPIGYSHVIKNNGRSIFGNTDTEDGTGAMVQINGRVSVNGMFSTGTPNNFVMKANDSTLIQVASSDVRTTLGVERSGYGNLHTVSDAAYSVADGVTVVMYTSLSANRTVTLPTASSYTNRIIRLVNNTTGGAFNIVTSPAVKINSGGTIGTVGQTFWAEVMSDGTDWWLIGGNLF